MESDFWWLKWLKKAKQVLKICAWLRIYKKKRFQKDFIANSLLYPRDGRPLDASEVSVDAYVDVVTVNKASDLRIFKRCPVNSFFSFSRNMIESNKDWMDCLWKIMPTTKNHLEGKIHCISETNPTFTMEYKHSNLQT